MPVPYVTNKSNGMSLVWATAWSHVHALVLLFRASPYPHLLNHSACWACPYARVGELASFLVWCGRGGSALCQL